uniref:Uncharacterized protein n=1 Tax=Arundo donax TaxID=35708 RepID=A0A0A9A6I8_ARUDO
MCNQIFILALPSGHSVAHSDYQL